MGTLTRLGATASLAPQVGVFDEEEEEEEGKAGERLKAKVLLTEEHCVMSAVGFGTLLVIGPVLEGTRAAFRTSEHNIPCRSAGGVRSCAQ